MREVMDTQCIKKEIQEGREADVQFAPRRGTPFHVHRRSGLGANDERGR